MIIYIIAGKWIWRNQHNQLIFVLKKIGAFLKLKISSRSDLEL